MTEDSPPTLSPTTATLQEAAAQLGVSALGVCDATAYDGTEHAILTRRASGLFADLKFATAHPEISCHPELLVDGARSVISAALCYWHPDPPDAPDFALGAVGRIARHAREDSYRALRERLDSIAGILTAHGFQCRVLVDHNDHVDREAAARSGVGFYGKNSLIITRRHGSWVVIGTIVTNAPLAPTPPARAGCGSCTACIDACPTGAIVNDGVIDARLCLSYVTQSRYPMPRTARATLGDMIYGCDLCQQACPWNRGIERRRTQEPPGKATVPLAGLLTDNDPDLDARFERLFIPRRNMDHLRRNALVAMGNAGSERDIGVIAPYLHHDNATLREYAGWALRRIGGPSAERALLHATMPATD